MADKIQATQISTNSSSWYQRLRTLQGKFNITKTSDPGITAGGKASYSQYNAFVNALNGLQSNTYLAYANWSSYKPSTITQYTKITDSSQRTKVNNMLTSLEMINMNNSTYGENYIGCDNCQDNYTNVTNSDRSDDILNEYDCTYNDDITCENDSTWTTCGDDGTYGNNGTYGNDGTYGNHVYEGDTDDTDFAPNEYGAGDGFDGNDDCERCGDCCRDSNFEPCTVRSNEGDFSDDSENGDDSENNNYGTNTIHDYQSNECGTDGVCTNEGTYSIETDCYVNTDYGDDLDEGNYDQRCSTYSTNGVTS